MNLCYYDHCAAAIHRNASCQAEPPSLSRNRSFAVRRLKQCIMGCCAICQRLSVCWDNCVPQEPCQIAAVSDTKFPLPTYDGVDSGKDEVLENRRSSEFRIEQYAIDEVRQSSFPRLQKFWSKPTDDTFPWKLRYHGFGMWKGAD